MKVVVRNDNLGPTGEPLYAEPRYLADPGGEVSYAVWTPSIDRAMKFSNPVSAETACFRWHQSYIDGFTFLTVNEDNVICGQFVRGLR